MDEKLAPKFQIYIPLNLKFLSLNSVFVSDESILLKHTFQIGFSIQINLKQKTRC